MLLKLFTLSYTLFLFSLAFLTLPLSDYLKSRGLYGPAIAGVLLAFAGGALAAVARRIKQPGWTWTRIILLFAIAAVYFLLYRHAEYEIEKVHLAVYSLLPILYLKSFFSGQSKWNWLKAGFTAVVIGCIDEGLQAFVPGRFCQAGDMIFNVSAGILGLAFFAGLSHQKNEGV